MNNVSFSEQVKSIASDARDMALIASSLVVTTAEVALKVFGTPAFVKGLLGTVGAAVLHGVLLPVAIAVDVLVIGYFAYRAYKAYNESKAVQENFLKSVRERLVETGLDNEGGDPYINAGMEALEKELKENNLDLSHDLTRKYLYQIALEALKAAKKEDENKSK